MIELFQCLIMFLENVRSLQKSIPKVDLILIIYNFVKIMLALKNNLFLVPKKKSVTSLSGIILEEDKGEMDPNIYTVLMA